jgi:hypothetical protein
MVAQMKLFEQFMQDSYMIKDIAEKMDRTEPNTAEYKMLQNSLPKGCMPNDPSHPKDSRKRVNC